MVEYKDYKDEELIVMMRSDQQETDKIMDYMLEKYKGIVQKKARAMYLLGGETSDLIQEGMIGLFKAVRDYDASKNASFHTFASLCIERQLYKAIQVSNRQKNQPLNTYISFSNEEFDQELHLISAQNPESILINKENVESIKSRIADKLSPMENQVFDLYLKGYDYMAIAEQLDKEPKSIDNAFQRIRGKVKECTFEFFS